MTRWWRRDSPGASVVLRPLLDFLRTEAAGGVVLVIAALIAMVWANSPWSDSYDELWQTRLVVGIGSHGLDLDLRTWINEGLMAVFFFVVGLEIKRELVEGELRDRRRAVVPAVAALGGMAVPAVLFLAFNLGRPGAEGWGIPVATDIAMAVGVLSLLGDRVPSSLKLFLLALAIVDDIGAILIIAVAYSADLREIPLLIGACLLVVIVGAQRFGVRAVPVYLALGVGLWVALHESGVHPTLAGVVLGLVTPTRPIRQRELVDVAALADISTPAAARETATLARESVSVVEWLEHRLHPWSSFLIVPLFALANAGISVAGDTLSDAASSAITYGVVIGLVVGKLVGVTAATWLVVRTRIGELPQGATWTGIIGIGALAGIGFTVSIFVAGLAFPGDVTAQGEAKVGILVASTTAALLGIAILTTRSVSRRRFVGHSAGHALPP